MSSATFVRRSAVVLRASTWIKASWPAIFHGAKADTVTLRLSEPGVRHGHVLSCGGNASLASRDLLKSRTLSNISVANVSKIFIKEIREFEPNKASRFKGDKHYEKVRSQNFGPVSVEESDIPIGTYALDSREFARRAYLTFDGVPYDKLPVVRISAKYNNTFVTISDYKHDTSYAAESCGKIGFKHASGKTLHAAEMVGKHAAEKALLKGSPEHVRVKIKGPGYGRAAAIRGLALGGLKIVSITDVTPLHVDGLPQRPRKIRRV